MLGGKCMEEKSNNQVLLDRKHVKRSSKFQMLLIAVTILAIALATGINAMQLHQVIQQETRRYVKDVSTQLAGDIDKLFVKNLQYLQALGDSFASRIQFQGVQQAVSELGERARKADYNALIYVSPQGEGYSSDPSLSGFVDMPGVQDSLEGKNGVSFLEGQSVLYTIPVEQDGKALGVLGGVRSKVKMQKVIRPRSFGGQGLTCILNQDGEVIISPTDLEPFLRLEDIFMKGGDAGSQVVQDIRQMQENMKNNMGGVLSFTAADNSRLVLAYDILQTYNWVLLTLVPANLITQNTDVYVTRTILITAITLVLSGGILIALNRMFKGYNRRLERIAFVDELTGALSSAAFQMKCRVLMNDKTVGKLTVVAVNVKEFKLFNERFGSEVGDQLLRHMVQVFGRNIKEGELVSRSEGDNFFLCLMEEDMGAIKERMDRMVKEIRAFTAQLETPYHIVILWGGYLVENPEMDMNLIQDRAKTACQNAEGKTAAVDFFYSSDITARLMRENELNGLFDDSLRNRDFQLYLQPKMETQTGRLAGAEALVRWVHPKQGMIYPSEFVPLFERNGNILQLDFYMFERVCTLIRSWIEAGRAPVPVSVNISRRHFREDGLVETLSAMARQYQIPDGLIEIEVTEDIFFDDNRIERVKQCIERMHEAGFLCSLDDFGAGYSALGLLKEFDVDAIKLDRKFFLDIGQEKAQQVAICLMELAQKLGMKTVAEGIETQEQLEFLKRIRCDLIQGYIFSRPLSVPDFEAWADARKP